MFTKNYYGILALSRMLSGASFSHLRFTNMNGILFNAKQAGNTGSALSCLNNTLVSAENLSSGFFFGNGTTPPSMEDYTCSGEEITTLSVVSHGSSIDAAENGYRCKVHMILKNTGDEDVTIAEICRKGILVADDSKGTATPCLIERVVLDEPVVIPAGENGTVNYITTIDIPS